jgi:hypothetical protein
MTGSSESRISRRLGRSLRGFRDLLLGGLSVPVAANAAGQGLSGPADSQCQSAGFDWGAKLDTGTAGSYTYSSTGPREPKGGMTLLLSGSALALGPSPPDGRCASGEPDLSTAA